MSIPTNKKTILITGSSSGLGKAVAEHFAVQGWNVAATMRNIAKGKIFHGKSNIKVFELDVTKPETIPSAIGDAIKAFGQIDVLFNNVGYGGLRIFEEMPDDEYRRMFETNFFGHLNVIRAVLPYMRQKKSGFIINVTSLAGLFGLPIQTGYCASKFALTGFTEAHKWELQKLGIETTVFEVGGTKTNFPDHMTNDRRNTIDDYTPYMDRIVPAFAKAIEQFNTRANPPEKVAEQVYKLVHQKKKPFRYHPTRDGKIMGTMKRLLTDKRFRKLSAMGLD